MNGKSPAPGLGFEEFRDYLRDRVAQNKPRDKLARELLVSVAGPTQPTAFFLGTRLRTSDKEKRLDGMTVAVARFEQWRSGLLRESKRLACTAQSIPLIAVLLSKRLDWSCGA